MTDKRKLLAAVIFAAMGFGLGGCEWMSDYPASPYTTSDAVQKKSGPGAYGGTNIPDTSNNVLPAPGAKATSRAT